MCPARAEDARMERISSTLAEASCSSEIGNPAMRRRPLEIALMKAISGRSAVAKPYSGYATSKEIDSAR